MSRHGLWHYVSFKTMQMKLHKPYGDSCNICCFGCLHSYFMQTAHLQRKIQDMLSFLFFSALNLCFSILPVFSILFSYIKLLMRDNLYVILCTFGDIFSMTQKKFGKVMQTDTLCLADYTFLLHWETSQN